ATVLLLKSWRVRRTGEEQGGERTLLWASWAVSAVFFLLTVTMAIRFLIVWVAFGTLFMGLLYSGLPATSLIRKRGVIVFPLLLLLMIPIALWRHKLNETYVATSPREYRGASEWLVAHSAPRDIVFDPH